MLQEALLSDADKAEEGDETIGEMLIKKAEEKAGVQVDKSQSSFGQVKELVSKVAVEVADKEREKLEEASGVKVDENQSMFDQAKEFASKFVSSKTEEAEAAVTQRAESATEAETGVKIDQRKSFMENASSFLKAGKEKIASIGEAMAVEKVAERTGFDQGQVSSGFSAAKEKVRSWIKDSQKSDDEILNASKPAGPPSPDNDDEPLEPGDTKEKRRQWQKELAEVKEETINEAAMHQVLWARVVLELVKSSVVISLFVWQLAFIDRSPTFLLLLFWLHCVLVLTALEVSLALGHKTLTFYLVLLLAPVLMSLGVGYAVTSQLRQNVFDAIASWLVIFPLAWLLVLQWAKEDDWDRPVDSSSIYQACSGIIKVRLRSKPEVAMFFKSLRFIEDKELKQNSDWISRLGDFFPDHIGYKRHNIEIGNVSVDPNDPKSSKRMCKFGDIELQEFEFVVLRLEAPWSNDKDTYVFNLSDLQMILFRRGQISNVLVNMWFDCMDQVKDEDGNPANGNDDEAQEDDPTASKKLNPKLITDEQKKVAAWFKKNSLDQVSGESYLVLTVKRKNRWSSMYDHWLLRSLLTLSASVLFSIPMFRLVRQVVVVQQHMCHGVNVNSTLVLPEGIQLCPITGGDSPMSCVDACSNTMAFYTALKATAHIDLAEVLLILVLVPVMVFLLAVQRVEREHKFLERKYFDRLPLSSKAIEELASCNLGLEETMSLGKLWGRFSKRFRAWNPLGSGDPDLVTCKAKMDEAISYENQCLIRSLERVRKSLSCLEQSERLDFEQGILARNPNNAKDIQERIASNMSSLSISNDSSRNFKAQFTVRVATAKAWEKWREWLSSEKGYGKQLQYILTHGGKMPQDFLSGAHINAQTQIIVGDQAIPRGFSLAHIWATDQDNDTYSIGIGMGQFKSSSPQPELGSGVIGNEKLSHEISNIEKKMQLSAEASSKEMVLDPDHCYCLRFCLSEQSFKSMTMPERRELLDKKLSQAKSYQTTKYDRESLNDLKTNAENNFSDFVRAMLWPEEGKKDLADDTQTLSSLSFMVADTNPLNAVFSTAGELLGRLMVFILCAAFVLIIPTWRVIVQHGVFYLQPFQFYMALNSLSCAVALWCFFDTFYSVNHRLKLIGGCLHDFEQRTISPSTKVRKSIFSNALDAAKDFSKKFKKSIHKPHIKKARASPFDLIINEGRATPYNPEDDWWQDQWKEKLKNLENWHRCVSYMRVFVSSSRLTGQTILLASAVIIALPLLLSVQQGLAGHGAVKLNSDKVFGYLNNDYRSFVNDRLPPTAVSRLLAEQDTDFFAWHGMDAFGYHEGLDDPPWMRGGGMSALGTTTHIQERFVNGDATSLAEFLERVNLTTYRHKLEELGVVTLGDFEYVKENDLKETGVPLIPSRKLLSAAREARLLNLQEPPARRLTEFGEAPPEGEAPLDGEAPPPDDEIPAEARRPLDVAKQALDAVKSIKVRNITKTQVLTITLVMVLLFYSVPLIWNMAMVNDAFDRHSGLLMAIKEQHRTAMTKRQEERQAALEKLNKDKNSEAVEAAPALEADADKAEKAEGGDTEEAGKDEGDKEAGEQEAGDKEEGNKEESDKEEGDTEEGDKEEGDKGKKDDDDDDEDEDDDDDSSWESDDDSSDCSSSTCSYSDYKDEDSDAQDLACKRYEAFLDVAIESAAENRRRFPLRLFGFVINSAVLGAWVALAASPAIQQARSMAPDAVMMGCDWLEHSGLLQGLEKGAGTLSSDIDILDAKLHNLSSQAHKMIKNATSHLRGYSDVTDQGVKNVTHDIYGAMDNVTGTADQVALKLQGFLNVKQLYYDFVCLPLKEYLDKQVQSANQYVDDTIAEMKKQGKEAAHPDKRRLAAAQPWQLRQMHAHMHYMTQQCMKCSTQSQCTEN